jgi:predicted SAM-dependent methyltransferase
MLKNTVRMLNEIFRISKRKCRRITGSLVRPYAIQSYLKSHPVRKLQIGAGANILDGWLNTNESKFSRNVIFLDATRPFPFEDHTFDYILSEHQFEHLTYHEGFLMLRECSRILKPGGKIRIATPDLEILTSLSAPKKSELQQRYIRWIMDAYFPEIKMYQASFAINNAFRNWEHRFLYDRATLEHVMEEAGFINIARYISGESDDKVFRGIEYHGRAVESEEMNRFETMVLEGTRPA